MSGVHVEHPTDGGRDATPDVTRRVEARARSQPGSVPERVLALQRAVGNRGVVQMLQASKAVTEGAPGPGVRAPVEATGRDRRVEFDGTLSQLVDGVGVAVPGTSPSLLMLQPFVVQRGKGGAAKKVVGWIVTVGERKLIKRAAIYSEKQMAVLLGKGYNVLVVRGSSVAKRVAAKVWGDDVIFHAGHIIRKTGKLGRPHFQPRRSLIGRPGEKGWHIFYGVAPVILLTEDVEAMAVYEDKYPGPSMANYLTVSKYVSKDSWLRHLDWVNPGELIAIGGDIGRNWDRERTKELKAVVFTRKTDDGSIQTYELDPDGQLVRVIVVSKDGSRKDLAADEYFTMLAEASEKKSDIPKLDGRTSSHFGSVFDAEFRIYHSKGGRGWTYEKETLSLFLPIEDAKVLRRVGDFYINLDASRRYLYVFVHPHERTPKSPGFLVPGHLVPLYLMAPYKAAFLAHLAEDARMKNVVGSSIR